MSSLQNSMPLSDDEYIVSDTKSLPIIYTVKEVAEILKTNIDYVHALRKAGLLPFLKLGQYKVRRQALLDFLCKYEGYDLTNPYCVKELING